MALGERILAELDESRTNDTLTRWLAHHIARLIDAAEQAATRRDPDTDDRATQARTAILDLWKHRSAWPHGWPPSGAATLVRLLDDLPEADDPGWSTRNVLGHLQLLHHRLLAALTDLAVAEGDTVAKGWLSTFNHQLTADEIALLTRAISAPRRLGTLFSATPAVIGQRPQDATDASGVTAYDAEADYATGEDLERDADTTQNGTTRDDTDAAPNPILGIAQEYLDVVADLLRGSDLDEETGHDTRRR